MKTAILLTFLIALSAEAQVSPEEEALILNQEMQFLQESATQTTAVNRPLGQSVDERISTTPTSRGDIDLERSYFGNEELDEVNTRTAAPRRKLLR